MDDADANRWECPHCGEAFAKPAEGWEDGLGDIHVICPGCDHRTTYPATRRPFDELAGATPDGWR